MFLITYDISNNKLRTEFSKFLEKYGKRLQYSVFEINNSESKLNNIKLNIKNNFEKKFVQSDNILIFTINKNNITRYGYAKNIEYDYVVIG